MKGITAFALKNSRTVIMTILLVIVGGIYAFMNLPKLEDPFITIREAVVAAKFPGMPVEQVERLITRPIEEEIRSIGEVDKIKDFTSKVGECLIHVAIKNEVPSEQLPATWKLLRNRMNDVKPELPQGTIGPLCAMDGELMDYGSKRLHGFHNSFWDCYNDLLLFSILQFCDSSADSHPFIIPSMHAKGSSLSIWSIGATLKSGSKTSSTARTDLFCLLGPKFNAHHA